jgi:RNA polymerase sigma-70 factor, ECF subfamily
MAHGEPALKANEKECDERLLVEAAQRDPRRFAELYEGNFERVYAYILRRVRDRDAAQDLTSDVFHRALANLARFEWRGVPFAAWLYRIAAHAIADRAARSARETSVAEPDAIEDADMAEVERRAALFRLVDDLPADQRRVILLRFAEERPIREVADRLARSEGAVKQLQFRALENLRLRMGKEDG